jgi:hypothetical protein
MPPSIHKIAEDLIRIAAHDAGASANKVEEDEDGWDALIAFDPPESDLPPDLRPIGETCLVQVKSTIGRQRRCRLKLSNALKFSRNPLPCFVVLLQFKPGATRPYGVHLRHFWRDEIAEALAAARTKYAAGQKSLNRFGFSISFTGAAPITLEALMREILKAMKEVGKSYSAEKLRFADEVGYQDERALASFDHELTDEDFIDFLIGLRDEFPIKNLSVLETRFGITLPHPTIPQSSSGKLQLVDRNPNHSCTVVVREMKGTDSVTLVGDAYTPGIANLDPELRKVRIVAPPLSIVLRLVDGTYTVNASHDPSEKLPLEEIRDVSGILSWLASGSTQLEILAEGLQLLDGVVTTEPSNSGPFWRRLYAATKILAVTVPIERRPPGLVFSAIDLLDGINALAKFAGVVTSSVTLRFDKPLASFDGLRDFVGTYWLQIDEVVFYAVVHSPIESIESEGSQIAMKMGMPTILRGGALRGSPEEVIPRINSEAERLRKERFEGEQGLMYLVANCDEN